jgi:hypothetical protein
MMFWIILPFAGIVVEYPVISPVPKALIPGSVVIPNAVSKLLTEANPCAVGQTPHIRWVIIGASLGSLLFMMSSKPLKRLPVHSALVTTPPASVTITFRCPSIRFTGSIVIVAID